MVCGKNCSSLFSELAKLIWSIILHEEGLPQKMFARMFIIIGKDFRQCKDSWAIYDKRKTKGIQVV